MNTKAIYEELYQMHIRCKERDRSFKDFISIMSPDTTNHSFIEADELTGAIKILEIAYGPEFVEDVEYWVYECHFGDTKLSGKHYGKEYVFDNLDTYLEFISLARE